MTTLITDRGSLGTTFALVGGISNEACELLHHSRSAGRRVALLMDIPRVIPCMPGAELVETVDEDTWKAKMRTKLGPINLVFDSHVHWQDVDRQQHWIRITAQGREVHRRGQGQATVDSTFTEIDGGTKIDIVSDLALSGAIAQYGRGIIQEVARQLIQDFASSLEAELISHTTGGSAPAKAKARPLSGLRHFVKAIFRAVARSVRRMFRGDE